MADISARKEESRARILDGAGRGFRSYGFGGVGVDALAKEAGVTSGAFYAHFKSKAAVFREAVIAGLGGLRRRIVGFRAAHGTSWRDVFIDFYLSDRRTVDLAGSCTLQSLTGEVARADEEVRTAFQTELTQIIGAAADGFDGSEAERRSKAIALLALLTGAVSMARAVKDPAMSEEIAEAVREIAKSIR